MLCVAHSYQPLVGRNEHITLAVSPKHAPQVQYSCASDAAAGRLLWPRQCPFLLYVSQLSQGKAYSTQLGARRKLLVLRFYYCHYAAECMSRSIISVCMILSRTHCLWP